MKERITRHTRRVLIAIAGGLVVIIGIILIPYPGPGWLVVFAGLAILATEFEFASTILDKLRGKYDQWEEWLKRQNAFIQIIVLAFTAVVVIVTIWLVNGFGIMDNFLHSHQEWLVSPLFR